MTRRRIGRSIFIAMVVVLLSAGVSTVYLVVSETWEAERNLHATLFTIRLVEEFVHKKRRWPTSWEEMEQIQFLNRPPLPRSGEVSVVRIGGSHGYEWPAASDYLQDRVDIDFTLQLKDVLRQPIGEFEAIKPNGPCFQYLHYGFVDSLHDTLRQADESAAERLNQ